MTTEPGAPTDGHHALFRGIATPLARAQAQFPELHKSRTARVPTKGGGEYSYDYADLGDALKAVRPILAAEGIAITQPIDTTPDGETVLHTILAHPDGVLTSTMTLPIRGATPQQVGSILTYFRRYALCAAVGIAAEDDADAAAAKTITNEPRQTRTHPRPPDPRRAEAAAWAAAGPAERADHWAEWKRTHPGWHKTEETFAAAHLELRDLVAAEHAAAGDEPFDTPETTHSRSARTARAKADIAAQAAARTDEPNE